MIEMNVAQTTVRRSHSSGMDAAEGWPHHQAAMESDDIPDESTVPPHAFGSRTYYPIDKAFYDPGAYVAIQEVVKYEENTEDDDDEEVMKQPEQAIKKKPAAFDTAAHMKKPEHAIKKRPAAFDLTAHNTEPLKKKPAAAEKVVVAKADSTSADKTGFVKAPVLFGSHVLRDQHKSRRFRSSISTLEPIIKTLWSEDAVELTG